MLDPYIIDWLRRERERKEQERARRERPRLEVPQEELPDAPKEEPESEVIVVEL